MKPNNLWLLAGGAAVVLLLAKGAGSVSRGAYSFGGKDTANNISRDPSRLLKGFADKLEKLFQRMRALGFDPILWEGRRTAQRAKLLDARGTGIEGSLHVLGAAADIVDRTKLWNAPEAFWKALAREARALGLTSGEDWGDLDHVQAVSIREQGKLRAMSPMQRERYVA